MVFKGMDADESTSGIEFVYETKTNGPGDGATKLGRHGVTPNLCRLAVQIFFPRWSTQGVVNGSGAHYGFRNDGNFKSYYVVYNQADREGQPWPCG